MADVTDRWTQVQTLFEDTLRRPADERPAWLRAVCGRDLALYREVEALLDGDAHQHTLLDGRAADLLPADDLDAVLTASRLGERVGPNVTSARPSPSVAPPSATTPWGSRR